MTGRDLIIYILKNNLEDVSLTDDLIHALRGMTQNEAASRLKIGRETLSLFVNYGAIDGFRVGNELYVLPTDKFPRSNQN